METSIQLQVAGIKPSDRLRITLHEAQVVRIGRAAEPGVSIQWDPSISREHVDVCWRGASCTPPACRRQGARFSIGVKKLRELSVPAGESFQIGQTVFKVVEIPVGGVPPVAGRAGICQRRRRGIPYSEQELRRVSFGNTERQMEILSELPKLISSSQTDEELGIVLSELLLSAIPQAEAVAVAHYDINQLPAVGAPLDPFPKPQALHVATREDFLGRFIPSRRLLLTALRQQSSSIHLWDEITSGEEFTVSAGLEWAFCCPIRGESGRGWVLYVSGQGVTVGRLTEKALVGDLRFTELVAQFIGSVRQVRLQQDQQTRLFLIQKRPENRPPVTGELLARVASAAGGLGGGGPLAPARELSGDFYDVFWLSDSHLGLVIADVCDKGIGPALFMALFRTLFRSVSQQTLSRELSNHLSKASGAASPATARQLVNLMVEFNALSTVLFANNYVAEMHAEAFMFATTFFAILDVNSGTLTYVNGGHDAPAVIGPLGIKRRLDQTGPAVGMLPNSNYFDAEGRAGTGRHAVLLHRRCHRSTRPFGQ